MATEIQEPNDIPPNSITDENANQFEILVYQQSQDVAGLKRLAIAGWKNYLEFNSHKVNNVASYVGMPSDYSWESDADIPYTGTTVTNQIDTLATKLGISQEPGTFDPLYPRFQAIENEVNGTGSPAAGGLIQRMSQAENDIQSIEDEIGSAGSSGSLTGRINALETTVGDDSSGLVKDVSDLQSVVGDENGGLVKQVHDLESKVYQFRGSIVSATGDNPTTSITLSNGDIISVPDGLKNGNVFDIKAISGETITINGISYSKGNNIAWVVPEVGDAYFDELGMNIDVSRIDTLEQEVTTLNSYFQTITVDSSWTSADIPDGIYQCSSICKTTGVDYLSIFIMAFSGGQVHTSTQKIDISNNFDTYWEIDSDLLKPKSLSVSRKLSIHKIGEV